MDPDHPILIPTFLFLLWIVVSSCSAIPMARDGCQDHCGNISIPFPFGITDGCYLDAEFFINCTIPGQPILGINVDVVDISVDGQMRVLYPVAHYCFKPENESYPDVFDSPLWLSQIFTLSSSANMLTVIGCDTYGYVRGHTYKRNYTTGCLSACDTKDDVVSGLCSGTGCCQTAIPSEIQDITTSVTGFTNYSEVYAFSPCSYAFVAEVGKFNFSVENLTHIDYSTPVVVDWVVEYSVRCSDAKRNLSSYACIAKYSECVDITQKGYRCRCKNGFEGNPYLSIDGCQDIDECAPSPIPSNCTNHSTCQNTEGSFYCSCKQGYYKNDEECIPSQKKLYWTIYAAVVITCIIVLVLSYCWYSKLMAMKKYKLREEYFRNNGGFLLQEKLNASQRDASSYSIKIFTVEELQKATNDFDNNNIIGQGGFGTVYKGELIDETLVAIKKSRGVDQRGVEQFINEVILLSRINNRNVVKLVGCCLETQMPLLVYEFINNGTLFEHLKGMIGNQASKLSWNIRMQIASQVAGVLFYLHSYASPQIIHRDIKSSNILLDQNYIAKVADFGISRLVSFDEDQFSTMVQGTPGYLDPEYMHTGVLTEKSDVYSFGVVLIELITNEKVFSIDRPEAVRFLASYFLHQLNNNNLHGVIDHNMDGNIENFEQIKEVAMIAKRCVSVKGEDRPYMKEVLRKLETLEMQTHEYVANTPRKDSKDRCEVFDGEQLSKACAGGSHSSTFTFYDPSPATTSTIEHMLPVDGGR